MTQMTAQNNKYHVRVRGKKIYAFYLHPFVYSEITSQAIAFHVNNVMPHEEMPE